MDMVFVPDGATVAPICSVAARRIALTVMINLFKWAGADKRTILLFVGDKDQAEFTNLNLIPGGEHLRVLWLSVHISAVQ